jgi:AmmeMemoRadiSam system protein A
MFQLPEEDQQLLLGIARSAVGSHLSRRSPEVPEIRQGIALEPHGVFVSIHHGERLRGCIGNVMPDQPLHQTTARCAVAAATSDPRFAPVSLVELPDVSFELSVLSIPEPVSDLDTIEVGKHGLIVTRGAVRGLLLPQVATQFRWNAAVFGEEHIPYRATS